MTKIGVVIADEKEYEAFMAHWDNGEVVREKFYGLESVKIALEDKEIYAVLGLIGKVNITFATSFLIWDKKVDLVLNTGYSGAVHKLRRGDIVIGSSYVECDFDLTAIGYKLGEKPGQEYVYEASDKLLSIAKEVFPDAPVAPLGCGDMFLTDNNLKKKFYEHFGIFAFDMESAAIASVCKRCDVDFISVRKVSDDSEDSAAQDYHEMNNSCDKCFSEILSLLVNAI